MEAIRKIIQSDMTDLHIVLPERLKGKKLEVIILPFEQGVDNSQGETLQEESVQDFFGSLHLEQDGLEFQKEARAEWDK